MHGSELLQIARRWHPGRRSLDGHVTRRLPLPAALDPGLALVVQGVRRCGKSTLLAQLPDHFGLPSDRCLFVNFEDPRFAGHLEHQALTALVEAFEVEVGPGPVTCFLDEVQHVEGWHGWLRTELDTSPDRRFVVMGSNAHLLSGELGTSLTGRHLTVELFPFDYAEYLVARPSGNVEDYLRAGGFPAPLVHAEGDRLLRSYFNDIVERDVRERVGARSTRPLRQLAQMLFESAGSEMSVRRAAGSIGMSVDTTSLYLDALESAYLVFGCPYFAWSERKRSIRNRKYYPIDPGLRRACVVSGGADRGKSLECVAFLRLRQRFGEVCYWRDRGEVDFVVMHDGVPVPIQVTWDEPKDRHLRSLEAFHESHPQSGEGVFFTATDLASETGLPAALGD